MSAVHRWVLRLHGRVQRPARSYLIAYIGVVLGAIGLFDIYRGGNLEVRTDGVLLLVVAVTTVVGCTVALRLGTSTPSHRWTVRCADGAALAVALWIAYRIQSNFVLQPVLVVSAVFVVGAGVLAALLLYGDACTRPEPPPPPAAREERPARATLLAGGLGALGTLLAAALAIPQFWYASHYEPSNAPPVVAVANGIDDVEDTGDHVEFTLWISVENKGKTPVRMLTSLYEVSGTRVTVGRAPVAPEELPYERITGGNYGAAARLSAFADYGDPQTIQVGPVGEDYAWIGPNEKVHTRLRAQAPRDRFQLLRITADVAVARADRVEVDDRPQPGGRALKTCDGTRIAEHRRPLARLGAFEWLTESRRELVTFWAVSGDLGDESPWWPAFPWTGVSIQHDGHDCAHALRPDRDGLEDRAMVGWASSVAEAAVPAASKARP
ncbi:hypothetical protein [Streptomyces wuyuanensis]|uniref:hypothetical protein n=1 Tax=Streptomyces wuyuanensis TaxID=1196353 RepID=UPI0034255A22